MSDSIANMVVGPFTEHLSLEAAKAIVALKTDPEIQRQVDEWAEKSNKGIPSDEEMSEYDQYLGMLPVVTMVQLKARRLLKP